MTVPVADFFSVTPVRPARRIYARAGKRCVDVFLVLLAAPVVLPVLVIILALAALQGGNPIYTHARIGRGGREFRCWKVRTMVPDADLRLQKLIASDPDVAHEWHTNQKLRNDPRITVVGRVLRRTSLDELPQLWNVVNGSMSLIGPRPFTPDQQPLYADGRKDVHYYDLRPGISGLWQVSRRNAGSFRERERYDDEYGRHVSMLNDVKILCRTFSVVVRATGH